MIPALVLTAGLATRLRPLSRLRAKAALPVAGIPLISRILTRLAAADIRDVVLNLHHLPHTISRIVGDGSGLDVRVRYSWESPVLGSAGGPRRALPLLNSAEFFILNGDTLTDVNLAGLLDDHRRANALVTLALVPNTEPDRYGGVRLDGRGAVTGFCKRGDHVQSFHFVGVQVARADAFADVPPDRVSESTRDIYPALIARFPGSVRGFITKTEFFDVGTPADYLETCLRLARLENRPGQEHANVFWDRVTIDPSAHLERCVVTDDVTIPAGARWRNVTIRRASGTLEPNEAVAGDLAIAPL